MVSVPHVAVISTVLLPVSLNVLVSLELLLQPMAAPKTNIVNANIGNKPYGYFVLCRRMFEINSSEIENKTGPYPLVRANDDVVGAAPLIEKLVVTIAPSARVSLAGLKVQVNPTGSPAQA